MNRKQARAYAKDIVRRGGATGHETRVARRRLAAGVREKEREHLEKQKQSELEEHTEKLGLTIVKNKLEIASGLPQRKA